VTKFLKIWLVCQTRNRQRKEIAELGFSNQSLWASSYLPSKIRSFVTASDAAFSDRRSGECLGLISDRHENQKHPNGSAVVGSRLLLLFGAGAVFV
jgi:hypothetical protein